MSVKLVADLVGLMAIVAVPGDAPTVSVIAVNGEYSRPDLTESLSVGCHKATLTMDASVACIPRHDGSPPPGCAGASVEPWGYRPMPGGGRLAIWEIDHMEVSFSATGGFLQKDLKSWKKEILSGDEQPGVAATRGLLGEFVWRDLGWTGSLYRASDLGLVSRTHLTLPRDPTQSPTLALIHLKHGTLRTAFPNDTGLRGQRFDFSTTDHCCPS